LNYEGSIFNREIGLYLITEHGIKTQKTRVFTTLKKNFSLHTEAIYLRAGTFFFTEIKAPTPLTVFDTVTL